MGRNDIFQSQLDARLIQACSNGSKLVLIHCPTFDFNSIDISVIKNHGYYSYPPYGLLCLEAAVEDMGVKPLIIDLNFLLLERLHGFNSVSSEQAYKIMTEILEEQLALVCPQVIGVSAGVTVSNVLSVPKHPFVEVLKHIRKKGTSMVIAGGVIANDEAVGLLRTKLVDFVFKGEGERKFRHVVAKMAGVTAAQDAVEVPAGIAFLDEGQVVETVGDCRDVQFTWDMCKAYQTIPLEKYNEVGSLSPFSRMAGTDKKYATVQLNRGCRGQCTFCGVKPFIGNGIRQTATELVIRELDYLVKERGISHIEWLDDDLLAKKESAQLILNHMKEYGPGFSWAANNGLIAACLDDEALKLCVESNCVGFRIGVESGNDEILKRIKKPTSRKILNGFSGRLKNYPSLFVTGCYMIGFENETYGQMMDTFNLSIDLNLSWSGFSIYQKITKDAGVLSEFGDAVSSDSENLGIRKNTDFVPTKASLTRSLNGKKLMHFDEILALPSGDIHDRERLDEIWFAFNLISNYVMNKNLRRDGNPRQFMVWVSALQLTHPNNAVITLFLAIACALNGDQDGRRIQLTRTDEILVGSEYWRERFTSYHLEPVKKSLESAGADRIHEALDVLRDIFTGKRRQAPLIPDTGVVILNTVSV